MHLVVRKAQKFELKKGVKYKATVQLGGFEKLVASAVLAQKLSTYGFKAVRVTGQGKIREAIGVWGGEDTTVEMPKQVVKIEEIGDAG